MSKQLTKLAQKQALKEKAIVYLKEHIRDDDAEETKLYFIWVGSTENANGRTYRFKVISPSHYEISHLIADLGLGKYHRDTKTSPAYLSTSLDAALLVESISNELYGKTANTIGLRFHQYA